MRDADANEFFGMPQFFPCADEYSPQGATEQIRIELNAQRSRCNCHKLSCSGMFIFAFFPQTNVACEVSGVLTYSL